MIWRWICPLGAEAAVTAWKGRDCAPQYGHGECQADVEGDPSKWS